MTTYNPIKVGDTANAGTLQLLGGNGAGADLTGATVVMQTPNRDPIPVVIVDAVTGIVRCPRSDLAPTGGRTVEGFDVEFQVTYADGSIQTFPEDDHDVLPVWVDLDAAT